MIWIIVIAVVAILLAVGFAIYNRLVRLRNRTDNAWAQVDVQLRRRYDLIPNVVETVKGYASHERDAFEAVVEARNAAHAAGTVQDQAQAENMLTAALRKLFALAEDYPDLQASDNFRSLQEQLAESEDRIAVARQIYNDSTLTYNTGVQTIPANVVARLAGFQPRAYFEEEGAGRSVPRVEF